ncbi:two-component system response regulator YcbB [Sedimentibacter acidaminivorans]|uniref:Two-component system response regulator YcbB n=1 Tax=Sedimentibacter acidaminivorans TaxID=913099 RepID=A0ABS4GA08_9FIRM|nr:response regulator [Sedimentibacter acidaminivorans]MBP1924504.1 two-component system response regulator YcbB [Sedimentibacter acidaminivorans]
MKIYIIEDDIIVIKMLENIIEDNDLGTVCGYALNGNDGIAEISVLCPDIVLIDLLMPEKDGIAVVKELKSMNINSKFIMISQVSSKNMVGKAYTEGVDFFISKPINVIEVTTIIKNIIEKINYKTTLENIKNLFINDGGTIIISEDTNLGKIKKIQLILNKLGMSGEKGAKDIISICEYLINSKQNMSDININNICKKLSSNSKNMEQRIRRAVSKGLTNISNLGIEDYMNEIFILYSNSVYNFEDVKSEMDYIRGKSKSGGKINIKKFIDGLMIHVDN